MRVLWVMVAAALLGLAWADSQLEIRDEANQMTNYAQNHDHTQYAMNELTSILLPRLRRSPWKKSFGGGGGGGCPGGCGGGGGGGGGGRHHPGGGGGVNYCPRCGGGGGYSGGGSSSQAQASASSSGSSYGR